MYLNYFNFKEEPFNNTPDPRFLFLSRQHEEAIESLIYGITGRKGFMALIGDIGTGKTTICRALLTRLDSSIDTSIIFNPMLSVQELLEAINDDFGNKMATSHSIKGQIDALNKFLIKRLKMKKNAVVLIDEAQHLSFDALEMLRMLSNLETEDQKLLQIVFIGQRELDEKLNKPELKQLNQRINIRYLLGNLDDKETVDYILHRLKIAGDAANVKFDQSVFGAINKISKGIPRVINSICDRALLEAYAEQKQIVNKKMVKRAVKDIEGELNAPGFSSVRRKRPWFLRWISNN